MSVRTDFIYTSAYEVLQQAVSATNCLQTDGINAYPVLEYILQSTLLRLTGFGEQKLRNITWEVATQDLQYRYDTLQGKVNYGEYSNISDKKSVFTLLHTKTIEANDKAQWFSDGEKQEMLNEVKRNIEDLFKESVIVQSYPKEYKAYLEGIRKISKDNFAQGKSLSSGPFDAFYDGLYRQRNKCAHNTASYQQDMITLREMKDKDYPYKNYFTYFAILLLLDRIFISAYEKYMDAIKVAF